MRKPNVPWSFDTEDVFVCLMHSSLSSGTNGVKECSLWRVWFKQHVHVFVQISEGSQRKEQVDSLFLMASRIVSEDCSEHLFCKWGTVSWRVHKETFVERWAVLDLTAAASQTVIKWFHNALSGNYRFIFDYGFVKTLTCNSEGVLILFPIQ